MTHHMFHISGVTDRATQVKQAEKIRDRGEDAWVHEHAHNEQCNDKCQRYLLAKEEQEDA